MEIKYFCSLGSLCHTARMMQRIHVKKVSYPFDWVFTDDEIVKDILEDDFVKFMDRSYYVDVKNKFSERTCGHVLYHEDFFFHKNPRNEDDYLYYGRCINRFREMLRDSGSKLFMMMYTPGSTRHPMGLYKLLESGFSKEEIILDLKMRGNSINEVLMKRTNNYKLLIVMNFGNNEKQSFEMEHYGNIHYLTLNTLSESTGVTFKDNMDNLFFSGIMCEHYIK
jgi:hypothetical protein